MTSIRNSPKRANRGATLLELVMVMVLLFILIGVAVPRFDDFVPELRVRKAADQVYAGLRHARNDASTYGLRTRFAIHPRNRTYRITVEKRPLKDADKFEAIDSTWDVTEFPEGVGVPTLDGFAADGDTGESYLEFRVDGTLESDATIVLRNDAGDARTLKVTAATGQVAFEETKP